MSKKGFTLAEMVAVIAILMILALLSSPFVKGYIDDSYNMKGQIFLRQLNEAVLNFEKDYPGTHVNGTLGFVASNDCNIDTIYGGDNLYVDVNTLVGCKYIKIPTDLNSRYSFAAGTSASCSACTSEMRVSMLGVDNAGIYKAKCACMDMSGIFYKETTD